MSTFRSSASCVIAQVIHSLIQTTKVDEPEEVYITKLALSVGRSMSVSLELGFSTSDASI